MLVEPAVSRRDLAVARSLDSARVRAEKRVQRFLDAGFELLNSGPSGKDFTVQEVVERSGQSLRSFYQYFAGKYELLLALFEETVGATAAHLEKVAGDGPAIDRLHRFVVEYYRICRPGALIRADRKRPTAAMAEFAHQLLTTHPREASRAFAPLMALCTTLLEEAAAEGAIRDDVPRQRMAGVLLQSVMFNAFASTISGSPAPAGSEGAEEFWRLVLSGIGAGR